MSRLAGKVAIITGTGSGMGRAAALLFAREGARIIGCDIDSKRGEETARMVEAAGGTMYSLHPVDLSHAEGADRLMAFALEKFDGVDILYNNAAMAYFDWVPDMSYETFSKTMREEVDIIFHLCRAAWPHLIARGGGSIINTASGAAKKASLTLPTLAHCAAKGAVVAMTRQYAAEGGRHGIRANTISPGLIRSAQTEPLLADPEWKRITSSKILVGRIGEPEDVANCALFLASDESAFVTGADYGVDGGSYAI